MATSNPQPLREPLPSVMTVAHLVYALHTVAIVVGIVGAATVVGSFVGSLPSIAAVIFNYVKRRDTRGTWVSTHYQWQIRTFWWAVLWALMGGPGPHDHRRGGGCAGPDHPDALADLSDWARLAAPARSTPDVYPLSGRAPCRAALSSCGVRARGLQLKRHFVPERYAHSVGTFTQVRETCTGVLLHRSSGNIEDEMSFRAQRRHGAWIRP